MKIKYFTIASALTLGSMLSASGAVSILASTDFTTAEGFGSGTGSQTLTSVTVGGQSTTILQFSTLQGTGGRLLSGAGAPVPADDQEALSDNRIDTGTLEAGVDDTYALTGLSSADFIVVFFNSSAPGGFYQAPGAIEAVDGGGTTVGSSVTLPDFQTLAAGQLDLVINGSGALNGRDILGFAVPVSDFGGTAGDIAGVTFSGLGPGSAAGEASLDFNLVAAASPIPEPSSALLASFSALGLLLRRRR